jgi:hypothetical protein
MATLGDVLGALISQIGKGRSQADMATLEIAQIYKNHPLLSSFPVPRVTLDEVVVDLKVSISSAPLQSKALSPQAKSALVVQLANLVGNLPNTDPSLKALSDKNPELSRVWKSAHPEMLQRLSGFIPTDIDVEAKSIAQGAASIIRGHITNIVLNLTPKVRQISAVDSLKTDVPEIETRLISQIQEIISNVLNAQTTTKDRLDVLVTASDLQAIPPEKLTTLKLTLRESDQTWTQIENEKGEIKEKLIPS